MSEKDTNVDQNLYSRQLGVFGMETMGKLVQMDVLIVGLRGVGVETAKNLILAGPRSVTLCDPNTVTIADVGCNFYFSPEDVGKPRAQSCVGKLAELNSYVNVSVLRESSINESVLSRFSCVVFTEGKRSDLISFNEFCHNHSPPIPFIVANVRGVAGYVFSDFGPNHVVRDANGEQPKSAIVVGIEPGNPGTVYTHEDKRHGLEAGTHVVFSEVEGMEGLNDGQPRKVVEASTYSFKVEGLEGMGTYVSGGIVEEVKTPSPHTYNTLAERIKQPVVASEGMMITPDLGKFGRPELLHVTFQGLYAFEEKHGMPPTPHNADHIAEALSLAKEFNNANKDVEGALYLEEIDDDVVKRVASVANAELPALAAFFGGIAAQEVVKVTGKFTPLNQYLYLDAIEVMPPTDTPASDFAPTGDRYENATFIFGRTLMEKIMSQRVFLVGAGALGCEFLKNFALMGVGCGGDGRITVTDMDRIEVSNLNRQFLFREKDVGHPKSTTATAAAKAMNPDMQLSSTEVPVGTDTEDHFDDAFWESQDIVTNALDNIKARLYVDGRCVWFRKPLVESGTLGTKANTQVVVPFLTESYGDSVDPPEESIPMCTLKNFPFKIEHTIEWSRDLFEGSFTQSVQEAVSFVSNPEEWLASIQAEANVSIRRTKLDGVLSVLEAALAGTYEKCVEKARHLFHNNFYLNICQLLHNFPPDYVDSKGQKFWSGPKRPPTPIKFDVKDELHRKFIDSAAHVLADSFGIAVPANSSSEAVLQPMLEPVEVPPFVPKNVRIKADDQDDTAEGADDDADAAEKAARKLQETLQQHSGKVRSLKLTPAEFEKDDDSNGHIDFISAAANLRARNYGIKEADRHKCKMIAGKIIPAIATTTCMITGLVCVEMYKIIQSKKLEDYRNSFCNLAVNVYSMSEPMGPKKQVSKDFDPMVGGPVRAQPEGFSSWDRTVIRGDLTFKELEKWVKDNLNLDIAMISSGPLMLYAPMMYPSHRSRGEQKVRDVYEAVAKTKLPPSRKYVALDLSVEDDEGDVVIPQAQLFFK